MNITFEELRRIKHILPPGSIHRIAHDLALEEQTVRNYFGAHNYQDGQVVEFHLEPGPNGGIVHLEDPSILNAALKILKEANIFLENSAVIGDLHALSWKNYTDFSTELTLQIQHIDDLNLVAQLAQRLKIRYYIKENTETEPVSPITTQSQIFEKMEVLRQKLKTIPVPADLDISQLANEVNAA